MSTRFATLLISAFMAIVSSTSTAQAYPDKTIRIVTYNPGGSNDFAARVIADGISGPLRQPVIVDNRGGGFVPIEIVKNSPPDGYTLLVAGVIYTVGPLLRKAPYDPLKDFAPISKIGSAPLVLVVHPNVPAKSVKQLIALARKEPGVLNYATGGVGGASHLATELFKSMAGGLNIVRIDYKTAAPALVGLMAGECDIMFAAAATAAPNIKSRRLKALAVTSRKPSALAPGLPTVAASGLPGYEFSQFSVMAAPANTPPPIVARLNQEVMRLLSQSDVKQKFLAVGVEAEPTTPQELTADLKEVIASMSNVIREAGIKVKQ